MVSFISARTARVLVSDAGDEVCPFILKLFRAHADPGIQSSHIYFNRSRAWSANSDTAKDKDANFKK